MRVLISAIACDPHGGSEGGVGWNAVLRVAARHNVHVLTDAMYRDSWVRAEAEGTVPDNVKVRFLGNSRGWHSNRMLARAQSWMRYVDFSNEVLTAARAWHAEAPCDLAHQVTYATWRVASPLWKLPIPFVWGPIGGAAQFPRVCDPILSPAARLFERLRDHAGRHAAHASAFLECITRSKVVLAANEETERFLRPYRGNKPLLRLPVAYVSEEKVNRFRRPADTACPSGQLQIFAGGNIEGRKGVAIALQALARLKRKQIPFHYVVAGGGPEIARLRRLAHKLGVAEETDFHPGYSGEDYVTALQRAEIYLLPSLRETTPVTLQEALLAGCFPVVADASAAGEMARLAGAPAIAVCEPEDMARQMADLMEWCYRERHKLNEMGLRFSMNVASAFSESNYDAVTEQAYRIAAMD